MTGIPDMTAIDMVAGTSVVMAIIDQANTALVQAVLS
jgi:hypothetical protein